MIVTANGDDFVGEFEKYLSQVKQTECHDMYGSVILPNGYEKQRRVALPEGYDIAGGAHALTLIVILVVNGIHSIPLLATRVWIACRGAFGNPWLEFVRRHDKFAVSTWRVRLVG
jgi:hypothetical protein